MMESIFFLNIFLRNSKIFSCLIIFSTNSGLMDRTAFII